MQSRELALVKYWRPTLLVLLPFAAGYWLSYFFRTINALICEELVHELGIDASHLGLMTSVYFLTFAAVQLPHQADGSGLRELALERLARRRLSDEPLERAARAIELLKLNPNFDTLSVKGSHETAPSSVLASLCMDMSFA
jgi:hypothetical protein